MKMSKPARSGSSLFLAAAVAAMLGAAGVQAANISWDGGVAGTGTDWGTAANWAGDVLPVSTDNVQFTTTGLTGSPTITLGAARTIVNLNLANTIAFTLGATGEVLTLTNVVRSNNLAVTIGANVNLIGDISGISRWRDSSGGTTTVTGAIGSTGSVILTKGGTTGNLNFNGANTFTGSVVAETGTLSLGGTNAYTGTTTASGGTLTVNFNAGATTTPLSNIVSSSSGLVLGGVRGGGTVNVNGKNSPNAENSQTFNGTTLNAGSSTFNIVNGVSTGKTLVNLGALTHNTGGLINFVQPTTNTAITALNGYTTSTSNDASGILGAYATVGGTDWATNNGTNIVAYTGYSTLTGLAPALTDSATSNVRITSGSTGAIGQGSGTTTVNTLLVNDAAARTITVGGGNTLRLGAVGGILSTGTNGLTIGVAGAAGTLTAGGANNTAGELILNNSTALTVNSTITNNGTGAVALTKAGAGTAILNAPSTNTGGTYQNAGILALAATPNSLTVTTATNSSNVTVTSTAGLVAGQTVTGSNIPSGTKILSITNGTTFVLSNQATSATSTTYTYWTGGATNNPLSTSGNIIVSGGTLEFGTMSASQSTSGAVVVEGGILSNGTITKSGTNYDFRNGTVSSTLAGNVGIEKTTSGTLTLNPTVSNTFTGDTTISEGSVVAGLNGLGTIAISGNLIVGSPTGGNAASYSTPANATAFNSSKTLTIYSNGSVTLSGSQHLGGGVNIIGGTLSGSFNYLDSTVNMTGGTFALTAMAGSANSYNINASASTANITGSLNANSAVFTVADGAAATDLLFSGSQGSAVNLTKNGAGMMVATGSSSYTGITTINGGTLSVSNIANGGVNGNLGAAANTATQLVLNGGTLQYTGATTTTDRNFTVGTTSGVALDASGTGAITFSGSATMSGTNTARTLTLTGTNTGANTLSGVVGNNGIGATSLTKTGAGTWVLSGANTYTGTTSVNAGTLVIDTVTNGTVLNSSSALALGGGTFQLKGLAATVRSQTVNGLTVNAGSSVVDVNNLGTSTTLTLGTITRNAGGTVDFKASAGTFGTDATVGTTRVNDASGIMGAWATVNGGADLATKNGSNQVVAYTGYTDIAALGSTIVDGTATNVRLNSAGSGGSVALGAAMTNVNTLMQNSTTAATVDTAAGTLRVGTTGGVLVTPTGAALTIGASANAGTLTAGGNANDVAGELILTNNSASTLTVNSTVANNGTGAVALTKSGSGLTVLNGTNTYTGATTVAAGTFQAGSTSALGSNSAVTLGNSAGATLDLNGFNNQVASLNGGGTVAGNVTLGAATLTTGGGNGTGSYAGTISGTGGLTKTGSGTQTLTGTNIYTGTTTISAGTLQLGNGGATGSLLTTGAIVNNGTLTINRNNTVDQGTDFSAAAISGTGGLTQAGTGTTSVTTLNAANTYTGVTAITGGVLATTLLANGGVASGIGQSSNAASNLLLGNGTTFQYTGAAVSSDRLFTINGTAAGHAATLDASGTGALNLTNTGNVAYGTTAQTRTLTFAGTNTDANTLAALIGNNGGSLVSVTKNGSGKWVLTGTNTFTGVTTINSGTLSVATIGNGGVAGNLGQATNVAGNIVINGGTLQYTGATDLTDRNFTIGTNSGTVDASGTGAITFSGSVTMAGTNQSRALGLTGTNTGLNTLSGTIGNNGTGATFVTKNGVGTWVLSNTANTYTGATTINNGILSVTTLANGAANSSIGASTNVAASLVINNGATFQYTGGAVSTDRLFTVGVGGAVLDASGTGAVNFTNAGAIVLTTSGVGRVLTLAGTNTGANTIAGILADSGVGVTGLVKTGEGTWVLAGSNTYTGSTLINSGTLQAGVATSAFGSSSPVTLANTAGAVLDLNNFSETIGSLSGGGSTGGNVTLGSGTLTTGGLNASTYYAGAISGTGGSLTKTGTGVMTLAGTNSYTGVTSITGGTLQFAKEVSLYNNTPASWTAANLIVNAGTTAAFNVGGTGEFTSSDLNTLTALGGASNGFVSGAILGLDTTNASGGNFTHSGNITNSNAGANVLNLTKLGANTLTLSGANSYTGVTTVSAGTLQFANQLSLYNNTSGSWTATNLVVNSGATAAFNVGGAGEFTSSDITTLKALGGASTGFMSGSYLGLDTTNAAAGNFTYSGVIANTNANANVLGVTKLGTNTLTLSGANTYTGATTVKGGTLQAGVITNAFGANSAVTLDNTSGVVLDLNNFNQTIGALNGGGTTGGNVTLGSATLTVGGGNGTGSYAGAISGAGGLTKGGTGTQTLSGANTYTGVTTISAGTLSVGTIGNGGVASGNLGSATNVAANLVLNGGILQYTGATASTDRNFTLGTSGGTFDASGSGALTLNGAPTMSGTNAARTLTLTGTNTAANTLAGVVGDNGTGKTAVTKTGVGTWTLTGTNTYTGVTTVSNGILSVGTLAAGGASSSIGASALAATNLILNGGTLQYTGGAQSTDRLFSVGTAAFSAIDASGTGALNFTNTGSMGFSGTGARTLTLTGTNTGLNTVAAVIGDNSGATSLLKTGAGTWVLSNAASTYTGITMINGGTLSVSTLANGAANSSIGFSTNVATNLVLNGGTLQYTGGSVNTNRLFSVGTSGATLDNSGTTGRVNFNNTGSLGFNSQTGARTLTLAGSNTGANTIAALIGDNGGATSVTKSGAGQWVLSNDANTYTGATTINNGTLNVVTLADGGFASNIGASTNAASNLVLNGGTLQYTGGGAASTNRLFSVGTGGGTLDASGGDVLAFINTGAMGFNGQSGVRSLTLTGALDGANTLAAIIADNGGATSVTKNGIGQWVVSGVNTYTGGTTITAGTLATDGTGTLGAGNISFTAGVLTLGNSASIADTATLSFVSGNVPTINLSFTGTEILSGLTDISSGTSMATGTWDATALNAFFGNGSIFSGLGFLEISVIPEPSTYAAILGALGLIGAVWRSRKRRA